MLFIYCQACGLPFSVERIHWDSIRENWFFLSSSDQLEIAFWVRMGALVLVSFQCRNHYMRASVWCHNRCEFILCASVLLCGKTLFPWCRPSPQPLQPACLLFYIVLWAQSGGARWSSGPSVPKPLPFCTYWNSLHQVQWERRESERADTWVQLCDMSAPILWLCVEKYPLSFLTLVSL